MTNDFQLPAALSNDGHADRVARETLQCYYGFGAHATHRPYTGRLFDTWDSTGTRLNDLDRFTADDLVAVSLLSVNVPPEAAYRLLVTEVDNFSALLKELGPDRDLVDEPSQWSPDWAGWILHQQLVDLPGLGPTTASKLLARKRPRLRPVYDSKVALVTGSENIWGPLRDALQDDSGLHDRLLTLRSSAGVSDAVSAIRVFDVLAWMEGAGEGCALVRSPTPMAD